MLTKLILVPILVKNLRRRHNSEKQAKKKRFKALSGSVDQKITLFVIPSENFCMFSLGLVALLSFLVC